MKDEKIDRLENAVIDLTSKFSTFLEIEAGRKERDKRQVEINERLERHFDKFASEHMPVISRSKKQQAWIDFFWGKIILPAVALAILAAAGYNFK